MVGLAARYPGLRQGFWRPWAVERRNAQFAVAVAGAIRSAGVQSCVGFNYRNVPAVRHARELIASGSLGVITHARFRLFQPPPFGLFTAMVPTERREVRLAIRSRLLLLHFPM